MTRMLVRATGVSALLQDLGRPGYADLGVATSGAFDRAALLLGNRLVGNPAGAAGIETVLGGLSVEFDDTALIAVTGASGALYVDGRHVPRWTPHRVEPGQVVTVGPPLTGVRSYLCVAGGLVATPLLGSVATDPTSRLGPAPLQHNDEIELGPRPSSAPPTAASELTATKAPSAADVVLRATWGPRADWLSNAGHRALTTARWQVSPDSDRVGVRLRGPTLERAILSELPSEAMIRGAVQVPPSGQPVVLGPDHPTTGGYPVPLVVDDADTDLLAQLAPGAGVRFEVRRL